MSKLQNIREFIRSVQEAVLSMKMEMNEACHDEEEFENSPVRILSRGMDSLKKDNG